MRVNLIVVLQECEPDAPWVAGAWDEYSIDNNPEGYNEELEKHKSKSCQVRVLPIIVPEANVMALFNPPDPIEVKVVKDE